MPAKDLEISQPRTVDAEALERIGRELLVAIGEDPEREALIETPARWARWWQEFIDYDPGTLDTCFAAVDADQMVVVSGIRVWSLCEHHLLPFWADVHIGYLTGDRVLGLSKFARISHQMAHRPQIQERLGRDIAGEVQRLTGTDDVAVLIEGEHLCMTMRGIRSPATMRSSVLLGRFREMAEVREEFYRLTGR